MKAILKRPNAHYFMSLCVFFVSSCQNVVLEMPTVTVVYVSDRLQEGSADSFTIIVTKRYKCVAEIKMYARSKDGCEPTHEYQVIIYKCSNDYWVLRGGNVTQLVCSHLKMVSIFKIFVTIPSRGIWSELEFPSLNKGRSDILHEQA